MGLIIGDNLGIHSITGFVESFSATHVCRMCKIEKKEMKKQCYADENLLRNLEQYHLDVIEGNVSDSGVKEACVWHDVLGFSVLDQIGVDIMHDLLEGVCKYDYEVEEEINDSVFIYYNDLASYIPNHICTMPNGNKYITVRG